MTRRFLAAALAGLALLSTAPLAGAYVNVCWERVGVCAFSWAYATGGGDCDAPEPSHAEYRWLRLTWRDGNVTRTVEVDNHCNASSATGAEHSEFRVRYTEFDPTTGEYRTIRLDWAGTDRPDGPSCSTEVTLRDVAGADRDEDLGCPAGRPPLALVALP